MVRKRTTEKGSLTPTWNVREEVTAKRSDD